MSGNPGENTLSGREGRGLEQWQRRLFPLLLPLSPVYAALLTIRNYFYTCGIFGIHKLSAPVISIGNITVGGTGKTPLLIAVAAYFSSKGYDVVVLTRGYGRRDHREVVFSAADVPAYGDDAADILGDEPILISRRVPSARIGVGSDRVSTGRQALQGCSKPIVLLDDGFQHRRLHRCCDIVLIDVSRPFLDDFILPAGHLRESVYGLKRADIVLFTRSEDISNRTSLSGLEAFCRRTAPQCELFSSSVVTEGLVDLMSGSNGEIADFRGQPLCALSGIGHPSSFDRTLAASQLTIVEHLVYPDHHCFTPADIDGIIDRLRMVGAAALITTEKDGVRLRPHLSRLRESCPVLQVVITHVVHEADRFFEHCETRIAGCVHHERQDS